MANRTYEGRRDVLHTIENSAGGTVVSSYTYAVNPISQRTSVTTAGIAFAGSNSIVECSVHPSSSNLQHSFAWGLDLSGTMQGAGGVGGLLATRWSTGAHFFPTYDGNGNVSESLASNGGVTVHYEYDPFGNLTRLIGNTSTRFSYRFSTKPRDAATGLCYYGYRWYEPYTGRWINRDPIEESGGVNLYSILENRSVSSADFLGMADYELLLSGTISFEHFISGFTPQTTLGVNLYNGRILKESWSAKAQVKVSCSKGVMVTHDASEPAQYLGGMDGTHSMKCPLAFPFLDWTKAKAVEEKNLLDRAQKFQERKHLLAHHQMHLKLDGRFLAVTLWGAGTFNYEKSPGDPTAAVALGFAKTGVPGANVLQIASKVFAKVGEVAGIGAFSGYGAFVVSKTLCCHDDGSITAGPTIGEEGE